MSLDLFPETPAVTERKEPLAPGAVVLRAFARAGERTLIEALESVIRVSPFRCMTTPGGYRMSVAMTNCGDAGWVTDPSGYRYDALDPGSAERWPAMPQVFRELAGHAAAEAGFPAFVPAACFMSPSNPGDGSWLRRARESRALKSPIVPVCLDCRPEFFSGVNA